MSLERRNEVESGVILRWLIMSGNWEDRPEIQSKNLLKIGRQRIMRRDGPLDLWMKQE